MADTKRTASGHGPGRHGHGGHGFQRPKDFRGTVSKLLRYIGRYKAALAVVFVCLYAPFELLIVFSFNSGNSNMVWKGFSLHWYMKLFRNRIIMQSVYTTLLVSLLATSIATVAGTFAAIGFYAMRRRVWNPLTTVIFFDLMNADITS